VEEEFQLNQKPPTNYYYKRWIWMQFPWVCMTMKCDYSDRLRKCFTSPTSYMSVSEEREFTLQALKIALEAKRKKQEILEKPEEQPNRLKRNQTQGQLSSVTTSKQLPKEEGGDVSGMSFTKSRKKMEELAYATNSFLSLSNLEKEMETINLSKKESKAVLPAIADTKNSLFLTEGERTYE
jgi:hypothetical protein